MVEGEKKITPDASRALSDARFDVVKDLEAVEATSLSSREAPSADERQIHDLHTPQPNINVGATSGRPQNAPPKDDLTLEIEEVLSEDLEDIYQKLPPERQAEFKAEGEKTAGLIRQMIEKGKFHGRRAVQLIVKWLRLIPGVNKFFLEQESKIKTDKLAEIASQNKHRL